MSDKRMSADIKASGNQDGMVIEVPIRPGGVQTVVCLVLGEDGRLHVAGPMNEPNLMHSMLQRADALLHQYHQSQLVQPVAAIPGLKGTS